MDIHARHAAALILAAFLSAGRAAPARSPDAGSCAGQDPTACAREAAAARNEKLGEESGARSDANSGAKSGEDELLMQANAVRRCGALQGDERERCVRRIEEGVPSGSVQGGGRIMELRETTVVQPGSPAR